MKWRRALCAFTFHTWAACLMTAGAVKLRCEFCGAEKWRRM